MNKLDKQYTDLLQSILDYGVEKKDRTGTGTKSIFGYTIRHKMSDGFPLLTTKKMPFKTITTELLWFLKGDTNIKYLVDNNCNVWNGDAYKNYLHKVIRDKDIVRYLKSYSIDTKGVPTIEPYSKDEFIDRIKNDNEFAKKWGELGPIYGKQWRQWKQFIPYNVTKENCQVAVKVIDQIQNLINELKTNPDSRRLMVNAWNVGELDQMVLPPCHYGFQVYTRMSTREEKIVDPGKYRAISLMWNQRSADTFLGLPFNIASYGLLLEIIAREVNMIPDELIGNLGDVHLYSNHIEQAKEQIGRTLTFDERYKIYSKSDTTWEEGGGNTYGKITALDMMDEDKIPKRTREPYKLPKLKINSGNGNWHLLDDVNDIINSLDCDLTFKIKDYEFHPSIKAPLSN
jgi:thymidylate synthase